MKIDGILVGASRAHEDQRAIHGATERWIREAADARCGHEYACQTTDEGQNPHKRWNGVGHDSHLGEMRV